MLDLTNYLYTDFINGVQGVKFDKFHSGLMYYFFFFISFIYSYYRSSVIQVLMQFTRFCANTISKSLIPSYITVILTHFYSKNYSMSICSISSDLSIMN